MRLSCFSCGLAVLLATPLLSQVVSQKEGLSSNELSSETRAAATDRYGRGAAKALVFELALDQAMVGGPSLVDRESVDAAVEELSTLDTSEMNRAEKLQLSRAWRKSAELMFKLDGPTDEALSQFELALALAPEDEELRRVVFVERQRREIMDDRIAEAKRYREAMERGEGPSDDLINVGFDDVGYDGSKRVSEKGGVR